jgi:uncharacterized protein YkwD
MELQTSKEAAMGGKLVGATFLVMASVASVNAQEYPMDAAKVSNAVIAETNAYRASKGLTKLKTNPSLQAAASAYAKFLAQSEGVGHTADGRTPWARVSAQGYKYCYVAENMWGGWRRPDPITVTEAARKAMDDWKKSPGHNANLLDKRGRHVGIGAAAWMQGDRVVFRVIQVFADECHARPLAAGVSKKTASANKPAS